MAIITTTEFKTFKSISVTTWDTLIGLIIGNAQAEAERYCDRVFDGASTAELLDGNGSNTIFVRRYPIQSIESITIYSDVDGSDATGTTLDSSTYRFNQYTGEIRLLPDAFGRITTDSFGVSTNAGWGNPNVFPAGFQNVSVEHLGGYADSGGIYTAFPLDMKFAMYRYCDALFQSFKSGGSEGLAFSSEKLGDYQYTKEKASAIFEQFRHLFGPFRRGLA